MIIPGAVHTDLYDRTLYFRAETIKFSINNQQYTQITDSLRPGCKNSKLSAYSQIAEPCNECESCKAFNAGRSLNIHELDAASNNSVDDIRGLVEQVRILPQVGKYSVYIIDEVHMLSTSAFNAFLKTLEEPPAHAIFILATTEKHKILPTILSRCQIYDFNRMKGGGTVEFVSQVFATKTDHLIENRERITHSSVGFLSDHVQSGFLGRILPQKNIKYYPRYCPVVRSMILIG